MSTKVKTIIGLVVFAAFIAAAVWGYNLLKEDVAPVTPLESAPSSTPEADTPPTPQAETLAAPDFTYYDKDGNALKLSDLVGKPVVMNLWASWCPPCRDELPIFEALHQEFGEDVTFLMLDLVDGQRETQEIGAKFVSDNGYTFPVYFDLDQEGAATYLGRYIPATIFIDKGGNLVTGYEGGITEKTLRDGIALITK